MSPTTSYGITNPTGPPNGHQDHDPETVPLLGKPTTTYRDRLSAHLRENVSESWADAILLTCYISTGLLDSSAVFIWSCFISMQTGNTVYLGLGLVEPDSSDRWIRSLISIISFCVGSYCFAAFHRSFGSRKRWVVLTSFTAQLLLIVAAATMVKAGATEGPGLHWHVLVPLTLLAFQSSGQTVSSRVLQYSGLPSVLTSSYCDLFSDPKLLAGLTENPERNQRIAAPLLLLAGACCGGIFAKSEIGLAGALWTAAGLKGCIVLAWMVWKGETDDEQQQ